MTDKEIEEYLEAYNDLCEDNTYTIEDQIQILEEKQSNIQDRLDKLYELKQDESKNFRDNLIGKCFNKSNNYIKILKKSGGAFNFIGFEFDKNFNFSGRYNDYNTIDCRELFIKTSDYFENWNEISEDVYQKAFNELIDNIKNGIFNNISNSKHELPKPPEPETIRETFCVDLSLISRIFNKDKNKIKDSQYKNNREDENE